MISRAVRAHPGITRERVDKALSSVYLIDADTNLTRIRFKEVAAVESIRCWSLAPETLPSGETKPRPLFADVVPERLPEFSRVDVGFQFGPTWSTHWLEVTFTLPTGWATSDGATPYLLFDSNSEACVYSSAGKCLQGLTGGDADTYRGNRRAEVQLTPDVCAPGERTTLFVEVAANGLFGCGRDGMINEPRADATFALARCELGLLSEEANTLFWHFVTLRDLAEHAPPGSALAERSLLVANAMLNLVDRRDPRTFAAAIALAEREVLLPAVPASRPGGHCGPASSPPCLHPLLPSVFAVGHCHIDSAWLWPFAETRRKVARSWSSQLRYMAVEDAGFTFAASQTLQYEWLRADQPRVFDGPLRRAVAAGRFVPVGASVVEPDVYMPCGESLVRQLLLGSRFIAQTLGGELATAERRACGSAGVAPPARIPHGDGVFWLPDTFGYSPQLPQLLRQCGLRGFLTQKLSWSLLNKPHHNTFWWRGLDGSAVLSHFPPANDYNCAADASSVLRSACDNKDAGRVGASLMLYGNGDGGGGPNLPMFEMLRRLGARSLLPAQALEQAARGGGADGSATAPVAADPGPTPSGSGSSSAAMRPRGEQLYEAAPGLPALRHASPRQFFDALAAEVGQRPWGIDTWDGELYLELHQGTLTSQAACKRGNRQCETALHNAEFLGTTQALMAGAQATSPAGSVSSRLHACWMDVLLCQFHDVLPGSSIAAVYADAAAMHTRTLQEAASIAALACADIQARLSPIGSAASATSPSLAAVGTAALPPSWVAWNMSPAPVRALLEIPPQPRASADTASAAAAGPAASGLVRVQVPPYGIVRVPEAGGPAQQVSSRPPLLASLAPSACAALPTLATMPATRPHPEAVHVFAVAAPGAQRLLVVDNGPLRVAFSEGSGQIMSLLDFRGNPARPREVIALEHAALHLPAGYDGGAGSRGTDSAGTVATGGNRFVAYSDVPFFWDAWDVMAYHLEKGRVLGVGAEAEARKDESGGEDWAAAGVGVGAPSAVKPSLVVMEAGPIRARLRLTMPISAHTPHSSTRPSARPGRDGSASDSAVRAAQQHSWLQQDIILEAGDPLIRFETAVAWHEAHTLLKVEFPLALRSPTAVYEVQFGCVERPTHTSTPRDMMQYEVCGHRWADLSAPDYGVALLNDCKYGHSCRDGVLALSLLRGPKSPDPACDMGDHHRFTYALLPHSGHVRTSAEVIHRGIALNNSLQLTAVASATMPAAHSFFSVTKPAVAVSAAGCGSGDSVSSVVLDTVKLPEKPLWQPALASRSGGAGAAGSGPQPASCILRLYEGLGHTANAVVNIAIPVSAGETAGTTAGAPPDTPPPMRRIRAVRGVNLLEEAPGYEGIPVGSLTMVAGGSAEPSSAGLAADLIDDCAPDAVRAAFATVSGPASSAASLLHVHAHSFEVRLQPFQIATFAVELE